MGSVYRGNAYRPKLILAAADFAEGRTDEHGNEIPPPFELSLAFQLEKWGTSAVWNGRIPFILLNRMSAAKNIYDAFRSYRTGANNLARWAEHNPSALDIVTYIRTLRQHYDR